MRSRLLAPFWGGPSRLGLNGRTSSKLKQHNNAQREGTHTHSRPSEGQQREMRSVPKTNSCLGWCWWWWRGRANYFPLSLLYPLSSSLLSLSLFFSFFPVQQDPVQGKRKDPPPRLPLSLSLPFRVFPNLIAFAAEADSPRPPLPSPPLSKLLGIYLPPSPLIVLNRLS